MTRFLVLTTLFYFLLASDPFASHTPIASKKKEKGKKEKDKKKKENKPKVRKEDIGLPTDFQHLRHIGWTPETGFNVNNLFQFNFDLDQYPVHVSIMFLIFFANLLQLYYSF